MVTRPVLSVVVNTFEPDAGLIRAVSSVLSQDLDGVEVLVSDDGSRESPVTLLDAELPGHGLRVVSQPNAGLSAARNLGAESTSGEFLMFLDDDDELLPGALATLKGLLAEGVGIASAGVELVESGTNVLLKRRYPVDLGAEMDHEVASYLPGSFAVSRQVFDAIDGFDPDLRCNHQRELFLRAVPWCVEHGRSVVSAPDAVLRMHRKSVAERGRNDPVRLQSGLELILRKHREQLGRNPAELASVLANAAVAAYRNGDGASARRHLVDAVRVHPRSFRNVLRLATLGVPPLARRVWQPVRPQ